MPTRGSTPKYNHLVIIAVITAVIVTLDLVLHLGPPLSWHGVTSFLPAMAALSVFLWSYSTWAGLGKEKLKGRLRYALLVGLSFLLLYTLLNIKFVFRLRGTDIEIIGGLIHTPATIKTIKEAPPETDWDRLEGANYDPDKVWIPSTVRLVEAVLLITWLSSWGGFTGACVAWLFMHEIKSASITPVKLGPAQRPPKDFPVETASSNIGRSTAPNPGRTKIFVSYSHDDRKLFREFKKMMEPAIQAGLVDLWDDTKIPVGAEWEKEIEKAIASARVAVLLVSKHFLASHFIAKNEPAPAARRSEERGSKDLLDLPQLLPL